ncbi:MAG: class I SAM-dependent methyltransferase [Armatimonadota bacterium]|jgi:tellurite methyltransferase
MADRRIVTGSYDTAYARPGPLFGLRPDPALMELVERFALSGTALDVGAGDGRHSTYLARHGFRVEAVDISEQAVEKLRELARRGRLRIEARVGDCGDPGCISGSWDVIVADTVLGHFALEAARVIGGRIVEALAPGGWLFVTALAASDPRESEFAGLSWTYYTRGQLIALFPGLRVERCEELSTVDHTHGQPHRHRVLRLIAQKEDA